MEKPALCLPDFQDTFTAYASKNRSELLRAVFLLRILAYSSLVPAGNRALRIAFRLGMPVKNLLKGTLFPHFCGGETIEEAMGLSSRLAEYQVGSVLDYAVEGKESGAQFDKTVREIMAAIRVAAGSKKPFVVFKVTGVAPFGLLEKKSAGHGLDAGERRRWQQLEKRVFDLCREAESRSVSLLIDAEESWIQPAIDQLAEQAMMSFNRGQPRVYHTLQMYRRDRYEYLESLIFRSQQQGWQLAVKLVRGAYLEKERERANKMGYASPVFGNKDSTDRAFNQSVSLCLDQHDGVYVFVATHNESSCMEVCRVLIGKSTFPTRGRLIFSQLLGMGDHLSFNLAWAGFDVTKYIPYGPVEESLPYLFRRAEENASIQGHAIRELALIRQELHRRRKEGF